MMWIIILIILVVIIGIFFRGNTVHKKNDGEIDWDEELEEWDWAENPDDPYGKY